MGGLDLTFWESFALRTTRETNNLGAPSWKMSGKFTAILTVP